ncbi:MAG TPA: hypothetical protein VG204_05475 [Terriglobia bacterium]|nr:hypothetical protein [Terriglobia bacterium]
MRRILVILFLASAISGYAKGPTPRIITTATLANSDGSARLYWIELRLRNETQITYTINSNQVSTYFCVTGNPGSYVAQSGPLKTSADPITGIAFPVIARGTVDAEYYVDTYDPTEDLVCPAGQKLVLSCVTYHKPTVVDMTNGVIGNLPDAIVNVVPELSSQDPAGCN